MTDQDVIKSIGQERKMTYVIKNILRSKGHDVQTKDVLKKLRDMEKRFLVQSVRSSYMRQLCWQVTMF